MNHAIKHWLALGLAALATTPAALAQVYGTPAAPTGQYSVPGYAVSQQELDAILAPIALYPDALLAQILMASTYPGEVAEAARWSRAIPGVAPQDAVRSVANRGWDPTVQGLMAFPQVLELLDRAPDWTRRLGDAFLGQQTQVWNTVQALRQRAYTAGQLRSSDQQRVLFNGSLIVIEPAQPDVVYVPYYDPLRIYGNWWWPNYAPMRWDPWPGYVHRPARGVHFYTGPSIQLGSGFFFGQVDWINWRITLLPRPNWYDHHYDQRWNPGQKWEHDGRHRGEMPHRAPPDNRHAPPVVSVPAPAPSREEHRTPQRRGTERNEHWSAPAQPVAQPPVTPPAVVVQPMPPGTARLLHVPQAVAPVAPVAPAAPAAPHDRQQHGKPEQPAPDKQKHARPEQPAPEKPDFSGPKEHITPAPERNFNPKEAGARTY
jgi:hypothetical protein